VENCIVCNKENSEYESRKYSICAAHAEISRLIGDKITRRTSPPLKSALAARLGMVAESGRTSKGANKMEMENGEGNKIFDRGFIKTCRKTAASGADPYSLKKLLILAVMRTASLERNLQKQIEQLLERG
jgi:hypothetical protein